jgi:hypothetical protein
MTIGVGMFTSHYVMTRAAAAFMRRLDTRQRTVVYLFKDCTTTIAGDVAKILKIHPRTAQTLCKQWVESGFFVIHNPSKKSRSYELSHTLAALLFQE